MAFRGRSEDSLLSWPLLLQHTPHHTHSHSLFCLFLLLLLLLSQLTYQHAITGGDDIINRVLQFLQLIITGWFCTELYHGFQWTVLTVENSYAASFIIIIIKFMRGICESDTPRDIKTGVSFYLALEFVFLLLFLVPSQFLDTAWEWSNDVRVALVAGYLLLRKIVFLTPFCCGCRNAWCCGIWCENKESSAGGVFAAARAVRRVAGRLWNFRYASEFLQDRLSLILIGGYRLCMH